MKLGVMIMLALLLAACQRDAALSSSNNSSVQSPGLAQQERDQRIKDEDEVLAQMQQLWSTTFTQCKDGTYMAQNRNGFKKQVQEVYFSAEPQGLTEADSLNKVQWKGVVRAKWSAERTNGTGDWQNSYQQPFMYFEKRNGAWSPPNMMLWDYRQAPCP